MDKKGKIFLVFILAIFVVSIVFGLIITKKFNPANKENGKSSLSQGNSENSNMCPECDGRGTITCPTCQGHGLYYICSVCNAKIYTYLNTCPECGARDSFIQHTCPTTITCPRCGGSGMIPA